MDETPADVVCDRCRSRVKPWKLAKHQEAKTCARRAAWIARGLVPVTRWTAPGSVVCTVAGAGDAGTHPWVRVEVEDAHRSFVSSLAMDLARELEQRGELSLRALREACGETEEEARANLAALVLERMG